jgi:hypothetical protein
MLTLLLSTSLVQDRNNFILQHDGAPHYGSFWVSLLYSHEGLAMERDPNLLRWPPRSPDLTPIPSFCGFTWKILCVLPLARYLEYFEKIISTISAQINRKMLQYCAQKWDIGLRYAGSPMMHALKDCGLQPPLDQLYYIFYSHFAAVCKIITR